MSKYKKGDKVVMEIKEIISMTNLTALGSETYLVWLTPENLYEVSEPLSTYTEPLEAKIRRQAAEITRLVADNKRLKAENGNGLWNIEQARAEGQNEAWELAREIILLGGYTSDDLEEIFNCSGYHKVMKDFTYPEAAAKVAQWEKGKEMSVESAIGNLTALKHDYENENNEDERHFNIALGMAIKALKQIGEE